MNRFYKYLVKYAVIQKNLQILYREQGFQI